MIKTNFSDDTSTLYHHNPDHTFSDVTFASGLGVNTQYLGWGCMFMDVDNDGWLDLLLVNGHVYPEVDSGNMGSAYREPRVLYWNTGNGKFKDISSISGPWHYATAVQQRSRHRRPLERRPAGSGDQQRQ